MYVCILNQDGEIWVHRNLPAGPEALLKAVAPSRTDLVVCVAGIFPWYWLADLCAREGMPFVLGHALSLKAMHGGKATNDTIEAHKIAALLRGGLLPQASVYPAQMRATRDLLRRRTHLMRKRAALLAHVHNTNSPYNLPEIGKQIACQANRAGVAERVSAPAVHKTIAVDLALITSYDELLKSLALSILQTATHHDAQPLSLWQTVPGMGTRLSLVLLYELHQIDRFPSVQDCVSYARLVKWAQDSAGKRVGTSGKKSGNAHLTWAFAEAATWFLQNHPQGQRLLARLEKKPNKGKALTMLAHQRARAVYSMLKRKPAFEMALCLRPEGSRAGEPRVSLDNPGAAPLASTWSVVLTLRL